MKKFVFALSCVAGASIAEAQSDAKVFSGEALRQAISDKTIYVNTALGEVPVHYSANGVMNGAFSPNIASFAGESVNVDKGQWWISGKKLCQRWQNWLDRQTYCYQFSRSGRVISWVRNDGVRGTARIGSK